MSKPAHDPNPTASIPATQPPGLTAKEAITLMQQGINLGNTLEVPDEENWGYELKPEHFELIKAAGFQSVRLPVQWSAHLVDVMQCEIQPEFFDKVDEVIGWALQNELVVVLDVHLFQLSPDQLSVKKACLTAIWKQIAAHYQNYSEKLFFEILNEPDSSLSHETWNAMVADLIDLIREKNPTRILVAGSLDWYAYDHLNELTLPKGDPYLMATFHYYLPFEFTHQGADWVPGSDSYLNTTWNGTAEEQESVTQHFNQVMAWSQKTDIPIYLSEFGAYEKAEYASRVRWTQFVREQAEARGFAWAYWEFAAGFSIYNRDTQSWRTELLRALIP